MSSQLDLSTEYSQSLHGTSIAGSTSAMQVRVTVDPTGRIMSRLTWFVEILITVGLGTEDKKIF